jgi:hypothetical protein
MKKLQNDIATSSKHNFELGDAVRKHTTVTTPTSAHITNFEQIKDMEEVS